MDRPIGRDKEQAVIEEFLAAARSGVAVLAIVGEPGIGKSTLCRHAVAVAVTTGFSVLTLHPSEAEQKFSFSVLTDLLGQFPDEALHRLDGPQRDALLVAALRKPVTGTPTDLRAIGTGLTNLLASAVRAGPVLLVVDDEQWVDLPSHAALMYAIRRLASGAFGLLIARRTTGDGSSGMPSAASGPLWQSRIDLKGVSAAALFHIVREEVGESLSRPRLMAVTEASGGNPYFAVQLAGVDNLGRDPDVLSIPPSLESLVAGRLSALSAQGREAAAAVAATRGPTPALLALLGLQHGLDNAASLDVLRVGGGRITFAHPLLASAALGGIPAGALRELHGKLATAVQDDEGRARHRALASLGADDDVAESLDRASRTAELRGAATAALELSRLALDRTPTDRIGSRWARRIRLAELLHVCGETAEAGAVLVDLPSCPMFGLRARGWLMRTEIAYQTEAAEAAVDCARAALLDAEAATEPELIVRALLSLAALGTDGAERLEYVARATGYVRDGAVNDLKLKAWALCEDVSARFHLGQGLDESTLDQALELERADRVWGSNDQVACTRPVLLKWADRTDKAFSALNELRERAEADGNESIVTYVDGHLSGLLLRSGNFREAESVAAEHYRRASAAQQVSQQMQALFNASMVSLYAGRLPDAVRDARVLAAWGRQTGDDWAIRSSSALLGTAALWCGDAGESCRQFLIWARSCADAGIVDPGISRFHGEQIQALVAIGDLVGALELTDRLDASARQANRHSAIAVAERSRALLASADQRPRDGLPHLARSLEQDGLAPVPFERARTLLLAGRVHRRLKSRKIAQRAFEQSAAIFSEIRSTNWLNEAQGELERLTDRQRGPLTPAERAVAELAGAGLTNRQVAERMFVSPKTVEAQLARVYVKLGISSRAQLGARMLDEPGDAPS